MFTKRVAGFSFVLVVASVGESTDRFTL